MSENFDSDLKKLKSLRVENDSNRIVTYLNIKSLGEKINHLRKICKESPIEILCVDETKLDSSNPDAQTSIDVILTNRPKSYQKSGVITTGVSDCHKMILTFFRSDFSRLPPKTITCRSFRYLKLKISHTNWRTSYAP